MRLTRSQIAAYAPDGVGARALRVWASIANGAIA
jgi:hypothetical protein